MRQWIPLDLRNVKDQYVRSQLRRLNDVMSDLVASITSQFLVPQQPDNTTVINDIINQFFQGGGGDPKTTIFLDDFMYDMAADNSGGGSGIWRSGSQGSGGSINTDEANTDLSAFGVHQYASANALGSAVSSHIWSRTGPTKPFALVKGVEIGFRIRRDITDFTRAQFMISISDGFSFDVSVTKALRFVVRKSDDDFHADATLGNDAVVFEAIDTSLSPQFIATKIGTTDNFNTFRNVKILITENQVAQCSIDGVVVAVLAGAQVPSNTTKLNIQIVQATAGGTAPGPTQKGYIDRFYIDVSRVDRGAN